MLNKIWFYKVGFGICGCDWDGILEATTEEGALEAARDLAIENAEAYGFYQDEEFFGDLDQVGNRFIEDNNEYDQTGTLDYSVEPYDPEKHNAYIV